MKILFDYLYITNEEPAGIKKYGFKLLSDFNKYTSGNEFGIICINELKEFVSNEIGIECNYIVLNKSERELINEGYERFRTINQETAKKIEAYDFVISTCANYPFFLSSPYITQIGVIHDLQMIKLMLKRKNVIRTIFKIYDTYRRIRKLDIIVTISKESSKAIKRFTHRESNLIYYAVEPATVIETRPTSFPFNNDKYILDVNTFYKYKNADILLKSFALIHLDFPDYRLYFKGNYCPDFDRLPKLAKKLGIEDKVYFDMNRLKEEEMSWLYTNASIFVSPSLMEGFGATPVEAITHETPVIVSNIETLKEVVSDCGTYFDPYNEEELAEKIKKEILCPTSKMELYRRKYHILERYSRKSQVENFTRLLKSI